MVDESSLRAECVEAGNRREDPVRATHHRAQHRWQMLERGIGNAELRGGRVTDERPGQTVHDGNGEAVVVRDTQGQQISDLDGEVIMRQRTDERPVAVVRVRRGEGVELLDADVVGLVGWTQFGAFPTETMRRCGLWLRAPAGLYFKVRRRRSWSWPFYAR
jgi:hypothetical protein